MRRLVCGFVGHIDMTKQGSLLCHIVRQNELKQSMILSLLLQTMTNYLQYRSLLQMDEIGDILNPVGGKCCFLRGFRFPEMKLLLGSFVPYFILTNSGVSLIKRCANGVLG